MKATVMFLSVLLAACAAVMPLPTASGRPEVTIANVPKRLVADRITAELIGQGHALRQQNDYALVFDKRIEGFGAAVAYGSRYDATPAGRLTFNLVDVPGGVKVYGRFDVVTNPGSGFERLTDATAANAADIQMMLERLRAGF